MQTNSAQLTAPTSLTPIATQPVKGLTPPPIVLTPTKPIWSMEDDKRKSIGGPTSLKEIQEMEAKEQEAQKAAEWERSHAPATVQWQYLKILRLSRHPGVSLCLKLVRSRWLKTCLELLYLLHLLQCLHLSHYCLRPTLCLHLLSLSG